MIKLRNAISGAAFLALLAGVTTATPAAAWHHGDRTGAMIIGGMIGALVSQPIYSYNYGYGPRYGYGPGYANGYGYGYAPYRTAPGYGYGGGYGYGYGYRPHGRGHWDDDD